MTTPQPAALPEFVTAVDYADNLSDTTTSRIDVRVPIGSRLALQPQPADESPCACWPGRMCSRSARCARDAQPAAAGVSDDELRQAVDALRDPNTVSAFSNGYYTLTPGELRRAILALRPQAESEQEKELRRSLAEAQATISERNAEIIELQKRIRRSPQAVPMTDAPFLKVHKGSICYKSVADDQSYGMWCPVNWDTEHGLKDGTVFYAHHGITAQGAQGGEG